ncbi:MAG: outer membrane protein assembly factor [Candidatus Marinimicrobia bacterium]|nr:outer membrane protein assembly factor [Candidatus Neomarinimicrobiota bacterium]MCF7922081.1 outer membrane protein assembly factor [Candidatus Neomarinimicrobiota bacterium]
MRKIFVLLCVIGLSLNLVVAEEGKSGWSWGGVPAVAYNSDNGFTYGIIVQPFHYGDGSLYPDYLFSIYTELSRTTKGGGINTIFFDSKYLMPADIRVTAELGFFTEQLLPFYGFNGAQSDYNELFEKQYLDDDETEDNPVYLSRAYYRHAREQFRFTADFQKQILHPSLRAIAGVGFLNNTIASIDLEKLNDGQDDADKLPDVDGLYDEYVAVGFIPSDEADGGAANYVKFGMVYDTRDQEANPMSGMWSEVLLLTAPEFLGTETPYSQIALTHRQYFTIIPKDLSFAYRVGYQGALGDQPPFYMLPYYQSSYKLQEGLGGSKSLRGILKNRIVGKSTYFANLEMRWKFFRTVVAGQNLYLALNGFADMGQVLDEYEYSKDPSSSLGITKPDGEEALHVAYGGGLRIALNENFIIAVDYGMAKDAQDGNSGLYIGLGYLF